MINTKKNINVINKHDSDLGLASRAASTMTSEFAREDFD